MARILHIIDSLSGAGPTRSLRASVQYLEMLGYRHQHELLTLRKPNYPPALVRARQAGITIYQAPGKEVASDLIAAAELVEVHYWHNPAFVEFMAGHWPAHRRIAWFHVLGRHAPQVISAELLGAFDAVMVTSALSLELPALTAASHLRGLVEVVPGLMEPDRLDALPAEPHDGFVVTYIGTANATKMHPDFVAMSALANIPEARFVVCGTTDPGVLEAEAERLGVSQRFEFRGYVENIRPVLATSDVFGYPLCEDTWATSEKSLQEAMLAGIPPLVFAHGGIADIIRNGQTGLVVKSAAEYAQALEYLYRNPGERARLGKNARACVQREFDGRRVAGRIESLYQRLMERPRRDIPPVLEDLTAAERFARYMLPADTRFHRSLHALPGRLAVTADRELAASSAPAARGEGGIVQFRNACAGDPDLLGWSGLVLAGLGRWEQALFEFTRALEQPPRSWRRAWYCAVAHCRVHGRVASGNLLTAALELAASAGLEPAEFEQLSRQAGQPQPEFFPL